MKSKEAVSIPITSCAVRIELQRHARLLEGDGCGDWSPQMHFISQEYGFTWTRWKYFLGA